MIFTQMGSLVAPVVQLMGVLNRFGITLTGLTASTTASTAAMARGVVGGSVATGLSGMGMAAPLVVGQNNGKNIKAIGKTAVNTRLAHRTNLRNVLIAEGLIGSARMTD